MARLHAITIHHHGKTMLDDCVRSLLDSADVDLEVVVVANACDEELPQITATSDRVHVVTLHRSLGFSAANNAGVAWAREHLEPPDYYYFVNNDTWSHPDALGILTRTLDDDEAAVVAGPRLLIQWSPEHINSLGLNVTEDAWGWDEGIGQRQDEYGALPSSRSVVAVTGSALLIDAAAHRAIGGWTELYEYYFEDIDLCLKARSRGWDVVVEPHAVVYHRVSATMTIESEHKYYLFWRNRLLLALVHWPVGRLLADVLRRVVVDEIVRQRWRESALQRRALAGALRKLPSAMSARMRHRPGSRAWLEQLRPAGSVPVITLPEKATKTGASRVTEVVADVAEQVEDELPEPNDAEVQLVDRPEPADTTVEAGEAAQTSPPPPANHPPDPPVPPPLPVVTWQSVAAHRGTGPEAHTILVLGWSPLPFENERMNYAPGARTWQLAHALAADGHRVVVACARMPGAYTVEQEPVNKLVRHGVMAFTMSLEVFDGDGNLEALIETLQPDAVVGATAVPSLRATRVAGDRPVWADLFGDPMAEAQARALVHGSIEQRGAYRNLLAEVLERGDAFSAVCERQRLAAIGQLGLTGRLNAATAAHELVHTVPCSVTPRTRGPRPLLDDVSDSDFVVLWSGGFNTWCDVDTLFAGLERAMVAEPRLRCVTTGGEITGQDESTYRRWLELVASSPHRDRFTNKGCLPGAEAARYRDRADLGVVTERPLLERTLGSSGRLVDWLGAGVPFVCSSLSELGQELATDGLALVYEPSDPDSLADQVVSAAANPERLADMAQRAQREACHRWSEARTTRPLREWARDPCRAPDHGDDNPVAIMAMVRAIPELEASAFGFEAEMHRRGGVIQHLEHELEQTRAELGQARAELGQARAELEHTTNQLQHAIARAEAAEEDAATWEGRYHEVRSELGRIHQSFMWRLWMKLIQIRSALTWPIRKLRGRS